jgi:hypothetical protein
MHNAEELLAALKEACAPPGRETPLHKRVISWLKYASNEPEQWYEVLTTIDAVYQTTPFKTCIDLADELLKETAQAANYKYLLIKYTLCMSSARGHASTAFDVYASLPPQLALKYVGVLATLVSWYVDAMSSVQPAKGNSPQQWSFAPVSDNKLHEELEATRAVRDNVMAELHKTQAALIDAQAALLEARKRTSLLDCLSFVPAGTLPLPHMEKLRTTYRGTPRLSTPLNMC